MSDLVWTAYLAVAALAFVFFFFAKRRVDFLTIAYIGSQFYFLPLIWGQVLQSSPDLTSTIQPEVYIIATSYILALVVAGMLSDRFDNTPRVTEPGLPLSGWYLALAVVGIIGALVATN